MPDNPRDEIPLGQMPPDMSIIIPAYNEGKRLDRGLSRIRDYFETRPGGLGAIEILVVDDGSTDDTALIAEKWAREQPSIRLISNGENRGKGLQRPAWNAGSAQPRRHFHRRRPFFSH